MTLDEIEIGSLIRLTFNKNKSFYAIVIDKEPLFDRLKIIHNFDHLIFLGKRKVPLIESPLSEYYFLSENDIIQILSANVSSNFICRIVETIDEK